MYMLILCVLLVCQDRVDCYAIGSSRSQVITYHSQEIEKILLLLLYYYHIEFIWMVIGDRTEWYFESGLGLAFERGSNCTYSAYVDWGPSIVVDGSQVIDLLSWAHTCLWEREGSLRSCRGFRLFPDRLIGGGERWRSKHHTETGSQVWGLWVQVWTGTWTPWQEWNGLVLFVPGNDTLVHELPFPWDGTTWLWSSSIVRTRR